MRHVRAFSFYSGIRVFSAVMLSLLAVVVLPSSAHSTNGAVAPQSDIQRARAALAAQIEMHPILEGVTVEMSDTLEYQAIAYHTEGRILISRTHTASIDQIIEHEVWHVIDWRDNQHIDWGESVPPAHPAP